MTRAEELVAKLREIEARVAAARATSPFSQSVTLIAISKTYPAEDIRVLYEAGHRDFGENYVQEWQEKAAQLPDDIRWHFIGGLQSNKAKFLANKVALIHSVDSLSSVRAIVRRSAEPQPILIQVNTGNDEAKGGVEPQDALGFVVQALEEGADVRGLMTIPPFDVEHVETYFSQLRGCYDAVKVGLEEVLPARAAMFEVVSMGMTSDFEIAIASGATHIRVGTAIFGRRGV